jgi:glucosamine--fructose-6-phosphate aminotransferase (isomerizing)
MCGIFGIVCQTERPLGSLLTEAGRRLSYRGYDSVGCATLSKDGAIDLRKDVGKVEDVSERLKFAQMVGTRGMVQLRWATFGHPSTENAQPHLDSDGDLVGAHNGNVVNNVELRKQFIDEGMTVRSTNDGESCVHAVERYLDQGYEFIEAIRRAYRILEGDYAFIIGRIGEDRLYAIKKGSGLVAGIADGFTCVSSDLPSILPLTRQIVRIQDGEIIVLGPDAVQIYSITDGNQIERPIETVKETMETVQKGGYAHFMLKEIHEQPAVAAELLHLLDNSTHVSHVVERMAHARYLYLVGCGTSYHACSLGSVYMAQLAGRPAIPVLAPQFIAQYAPTLSSDDVGLFVSQSGETKDVLNAINASQPSGMGILGLVNVIGSSLTQVSERYIPLACGYEISVPATKTYTNQVIAMLYLAMRMGGVDTNRLSTLPDLIEQTIQRTDPAVTAIGPSLSAWDDLYCVGYGSTYPVALEGALKLKEITYAHCEGMLSTEFKHGPLSAVREDYPVIFVAGPDDIPLMISGINEVTCRSGRAVVIGPEDTRLRANADDLILLPDCDPATNAVLAAIPLQLLSYRISVARGLNPDFPRNLSKTLTVD